MKEQTEMMDVTSKKPENMSKYAGLGAAITAELMIGFLFSVGVILAIGVVDGLSHFIGTLMSNK